MGAGLCGFICQHWWCLRCRGCLGDQYQQQQQQQQQQKQQHLESRRNVWTCKSRHPPTTLPQELNFPSPELPIIRSRILAHLVFFYSLLYSKVHLDLCKQNQVIQTIRETAFFARPSQPHVRDYRVVPKCTRDLGNWASSSVNELKIPDQNDNALRLHFSCNSPPHLALLPPPPPLSYINNLTIQTGKWINPVSMNGLFKY